MKIEVTLEQMLGDGDYGDWSVIWGIRYESNLEGILSPEVVPNDTASNDKLALGDVAEVLGSVNGENDGADWVCVVRMKDGRFACVRAGCDYTGWDCQSGGSSNVSSSLESLIRFGLSVSERSRLGCNIEGDEKDGAK